jgi:hypothetical protein
MSHVPTPWEALLLAACAYRIWRMLSEDEILNRPRRWLVQLSRDWQEGEVVPEGYRARLAEFINCPWCLGFHVSWVVWLLWILDEKWTLILATPFAISAAVGVIRSKLDPE